MSDPFMPADDRYGDEVIERLQSRLTAAETRIKELEKNKERLLTIIHNQRTNNRNSKRDNLRAELDKLKGTK